MSQQLTVELSDEVYSIIERQAREANTPPARLASASLTRYFRAEHDTEQKTRGTSRRTGKNKAALQTARERFEEHFGSVDLGYATGLNNEQIDADLAREYANVNEYGEA